ncbi:hypothetical protein Aduo_016360 [Ancylostoma duodenale]
MCQCSTLSSVECPIVTEVMYSPQNLSHGTVPSTKLPSSKRRTTSLDKEELTSNTLHVSISLISRNTITKTSASNGPATSKRTTSARYRPSQVKPTGAVPTYEVRTSTIFDSEPTVSANVTGYGSGPSSHYSSKKNAFTLENHKKATSPYVTPTVFTNVETREKTRKANYVTTLIYESYEPKSTEIFTPYEENTFGNSFEWDTYWPTSTFPKSSIAFEDHTPTALSNFGETYGHEETEMATTYRGNTIRNSLQWDDSSSSPYSSTASKENTPITSSKLGGSYEPENIGVTTPDRTTVSRNALRNSGWDRTYHPTSTFPNSIIVLKKNTPTASNELAGIYGTAIDTTTATKYSNSYSVPGYFSIQSTTEPTSALEMTFATISAHSHNQIKTTERDHKDGPSTYHSEMSAVSKHFSRLQATSSTESHRALEETTLTGTGYDIVTRGANAGNTAATEGTSSSVVTEHITREEKTTPEELYTVPAILTPMNTLHLSAFTDVTGLHGSLQKDSAVSTVTITPLVSRRISHTSPIKSTEYTSTTTLALFPYPFTATSGSSLNITRTRKEISELTSTAYTMSSTLSSLEPVPVTAAISSSRKEPTRTATLESSLNIARTHEGIGEFSSTAYTFTSTLTSVSSTADTALLHEATHSAAVTPMSTRPVTAEEYKSIKLTGATKRTEVAHKQTYETLFDEQKTAKIMVSTMTKTAAAMTITGEPVQESLSDPNRETESSAGIVLGPLIPIKVTWSSTPQELPYGNVSKPKATTTAIFGAPSLTSKSEATEGQRFQGSSRVVGETEVSRATASGSFNKISSTIFTKTYKSSMTIPWLARLTSPISAFTSVTFTSQPKQVSSQRYLTFPYTSGSDTVEVMTAGFAPFTTPSFPHVPLTSANDQLQKEGSTLGGKTFPVNLLRTTVFNGTRTTSLPTYAIKSITQHISSVDGITKSTEETILSTPSDSYYITTSDEEVNSSPSYCAMPCPSNYMEGPSLCYNILPLALSTTYRRALSYCQMHDNSDLAREQDFLDESVVYIARMLSMRANISTGRFYVNERMFKNRGRVRLVDLWATTGSTLAINSTVDVREVHFDVAALCHRTKYCRVMACNLSDFQYFQRDKELILPENLNKVELGENIDIPCSNGSNIITFKCEERGNIRPHPSTIDCLKRDVGGGVADTETPWDARLQGSCEKCHNMGTEMCLVQPGGYACVCKLGWTGFRCWRAPDMCELLLNFTCGKNGRCVTEVDKVYCECDKGFDGPHCEISKISLSWFSHNESSVLSAATGSVLVMTSGETLVMIGKAILLFHLPKAKDDPQGTYQEIRSIFLMFAGYLFLFLHHPGLLALNFWKCTLAWHSTTLFYTLAIFTYVLEAINASEVIRVKQNNIWAHDIDGKSTWYFGQTFRLAFSFATVGGIVIAIGCGSFDQLTSSWTCMGRYSSASLNLWLAILLLNFICVLAATAYSYEAIFVQRNISQYEDRIEKNVELMNSARRNDVLKCQRDVYFTCMGPWILSGVWLLQTAFCDWVENSFSNGLLLVLSTSKTLGSILQSAFTTPSVFLFLASSHFVQLF